MTATSINQHSSIVCHAQKMNHFPGAKAGTHSIVERLVSHKHAMVIRGLPQLVGVLAPEANVQGNRKIQPMETVDRL